MLGGVYPTFISNYFSWNVLVRHLTRVMSSVFRKHPITMRFCFPKALDEVSRLRFSENGRALNSRFPEDPGAGAST